MAMKLLSLAVGAATAVISSATASSGNTIAAARPLSSSSLGVTPRTLQNAATSSSYAYLDSLSGYSLQYSNCLRVKIPQDSDDDDVDGNVNFYNGAYRAQYSVMAIFQVCGDGNYGSGNQCYDCDYGVEYAMEVNEFLETTLDHWENYCTACQNACGGRRKLEEAADEMDCSTCSNSCMNYYQGGDNGNDETNYMECQAGYEGDDGMQLYYGPQCSDDGQIVIGVFYDDECTIRTKVDTPIEFDYYKFGTATSGCVDCSNGDYGEETCGDMYQDAYHCVNGKDMQGQDDMSACSAVKKAFTVIDYGGVKKRHSGADGFIKIFFGMLLISFVGGFFFLTFTYYVRHRGEKSQPMLSSDDVHESEGEAAHGGTLT
mmetsp:Transcript_7937/g.14309  ORF Transcript_7937/g.14309 Transcript_7937/m.14309 type:complete len:373 (-) Transcript_7937:193-1311(-)|eukprot:CAMPEP_0201875704 /NCGR_PEP_ID=MMETSP0902-20130614/7594_1 /ASSEMBLY_ACC=CAM_ASM_000551 /TAXON_ID=420261 /ORGANISM="Thalassiosira antarctica, Strain CCMP982" /LENGTH=372 /DNA_ID=CAMNT_0048402801 /DNA_START=84 /DNA_END=1202 /DNA_ORIENTATION=-